MGWGGWPALRAGLFAQNESPVVRRKQVDSPCRSSCLLPRLEVRSLPKGLHFRQRGIVSTPAGRAKRSRKWRPQLRGIHSRVKRGQSHCQDGPSTARPIYGSLSRLEIRQACFTQGKMKQKAIDKEVSFPVTWHVEGLGRSSPALLFLTTNPTFPTPLQARHGKRVF